MKQLWQKALTYFGLGEDEEYNDYDDFDEFSRYPEPSSTVRKITRLPDVRRAERAAPLRAQVQTNESNLCTMEPSSFADAQSIADKLKARSAVVASFAKCDKALSQRLLDFVCGVTYGMDGAIQKMDGRVYVFTPKNVVVSAEDRRRLRDRGYSFGDPE